MPPDRPGTGTAVVIVIERRLKLSKELQFPTGRQIWQREGYKSADSANLQTFNPLFPKGKDLGVFLNLPKIPLPLRRIEVSIPPRTGPGETAGIPVVLEYETKDAPLYPPEGAFCRCLCSLRARFGRSES